MAEIRHQAVDVGSDALPLPCHRVRLDARTLRGPVAFRKAETGVAGQFVKKFGKNRYFMMDESKPWVPRWCRRTAPVSATGAVRPGSAGVRQRFHAATE